MDYINNINTIVSLIAGLIAIYSAFKARKFKNQTEKLKKEIGVQLEFTDLLLNLNLCIDKISKLPYEYKRGFDLSKEIMEIQSLFDKITALAIAQNTELFPNGLNFKTTKWIDELNFYRSNYELMHNNDDRITLKGNISKSLNLLRSEITSTISKCKQHNF